MAVILIQIELPSGRLQTFTGREAWTLSQLHNAGEKGCTPLHNAAPRWSAYVFKLRRKGIDIETIPQFHGGAYSGRHGRYVLKTPLIITKEVHSNA